METIGNSNNLFNRERKFLCRLVYSTVFLLLIYDLISSTALYQLHSPVLIYPYVDITYILFNLSHAGDIVTGSLILSYCFSIFLFLSCITIIIYPDKRFFIFSFLILYFFYFLVYNGYGAHHIHSKVGILFISVPFLFIGNNFMFTWEAVRYYTLFLYADSFLWKLFRLSWLNNKQGILIMKQNLIPLLYQHPDNNFSNLYYFFFNHYFYADILYRTGFLLEGIFLIGFFTKRFDKFLVIISLLLAIGFLFMADAFAFELLILDVTLIYSFRTEELINSFVYSSRAKTGKALIK